MSKKLIFITIIFFVLVAGFGFAKMYIADMFNASATSLISSGDYTTALKYSTTAIELNPKEPNYYRSRARIYLVSLATKTSPNEIMTYKLLALADMQNALKLNPTNLVTIRNLLPLYYFLASKDLTKPASPENVDPQFVQYAREFYYNTALHSKNDVGVYILLYRYQKRLDLLEDAKGSIEKIKQLRPDLLDWYDGIK